ncbi:hypothetical protein E2C01_017165 [Portunus trituberculatus]|uniref:Uncharacterized protein n=1 Tax=Portunus trituberculatus TaxID=210409 RepID=A0A5B7DSN2_PORTR|nr:hypothetical protein [Portunus trituberculatus]
MDFVSDFFFAAIVVFLTEAHWRSIPVSCPAESGPAPHGSSGLRGVFSSRQMVKVASRVT